MAKTKAPSGLTVSRSGTKYTVKWKVNVSSSSRKAQKVCWRTRSEDGVVSAWSAAVAVGKSATTFTRDLTVVTSVQFAVASKQSGKSYSDYTWSPWYDVSAPLPPVDLAYENESITSGTFSWAAGAEDEHAPFTEFEYQTGYSAGTGDEVYGAETPTSDQSVTVTETDVSGLHRRWFRVRACGPGGCSEWQTISHIYGLAPEPEIVSVKAALGDGNSYALTVRWRQAGGTERVETMGVQYHIGVPAVSGGALAPAVGAGWTAAGTELPMRSEEDYAATVSTATTVNEEEAVFVRIRSVHDGMESYSAPVQATEFVGALTSPSLTIGSIDADAATVTFDSVTNNSAVPGWLEAFAFAQSTGARQSLGRIAASAGETVSSTVMHFVYDPAESYSFGVQAVSGDGSAMRSAVVWSSTISMAAPTNVSVTKTDVSGTVRVSWAWAAWADGAVIQWSDNPLAWDSNEEPNSYAVEKQTTFCYIAGLETDGTVYYFRVALSSGKEKDGNKVVGLFADPVTIGLASAPSDPVLYLSRSIAAERDTVTAGWIYAGTDGTAQATAEICEAEWSDGWVYGELLSAVGSGQSTDISITDMVELHGWQTGETHYLAVRTTSESGMLSGWSAPVSITIAEAPSISLEDPFSATFAYTDVFGGDGSTEDFALSYAPDTSPSASFTVTVDGIEEENYTISERVLSLPDAPDAGSEILVAYTAAGKALRAMPFAVTCSGAGAGSTALRITRRTAYAMDRPDGTEMDGWEGETVFAAMIVGEAEEYPVTTEDLTGRLDDGAAYTLTAVITDVYGQTAVAGIDFEVHWDHQAWIPTATVTVDAEHLAVAITPEAGEDYAAGDVCDIYRLSADAPELIVRGGTFGETYYDPYPAFGVNGGHRVVCRTANGDYITERNEPAWVDLGEEDGDTLNEEQLVIDYGTGRAALPYNLTLEQSWKKDFLQTAYLNGSVVGDWNRSVRRSMTASTVLVRSEHEPEALDMRALARASGLCHVRTPEGSSFCADVQVSESRGYSTAAIAYTLTISGVDPEGFDGMTAEEWAEFIGE